MCVCVCVCASACPCAGVFLSLIYWTQLPFNWASFVAQMVKHLPVMWESWVRSLGWEDPLEKEMATHSSSLAWKIPGLKEPGRL